MKDGSWMVKNIFYDMDDTLVRTREKWKSAIDAYLELQHLSPNIEFITFLLGKNCRDICIDINNRFHQVKEGKMDYHVDILRGFLMEQFDRNSPVEIPGASLFLKKMSDRFSQYIVSGSPIQIVSQVVSQKNWSPYVKDFISSETVLKGKPDPEVYNLLRLKLQAKEEECLIFEDSSAGMEAARCAGIRCVCINSYPLVGNNGFPVCIVPDFSTLLKNSHLLDFTWS